MSDEISFEAFREQWIKSIGDGDPVAEERERRFAFKLFGQWRDIGHLADDVVYLDGAGDTGVDLIYIERGESDDDTIAGETWYVVEAKLGTVHDGIDWLVKSAQQALVTLDRASSQTSPQGLATRLA